MNGSKGVKKKTERLLFEKSQQVWTHWEMFGNGVILRHENREIPFRELIFNPEHSKTIN